MSRTPTLVALPTVAPEAPHGFVCWHTLKAEEVLKRLDTSPAGLGEVEAASRRERCGTNELLDHGLKSAWAILWEQATSAMILVLVGAALIQGFVAVHQNEPREWIDVLAILAIVVLNIALGVFQEYRAEKAMAALKTVSAPRVKVRRAGKISDLVSRDLVPGDVVLLEVGNVVAADCRLLESANLRTQEASLTGESMPVDKHTEELDGADLSLGDRANMVFMGTSVVYGRGCAVVVETGMNTQLGRIAGLIQNIENEKTPLQRRLQDLGRRIGVAIVVIVIVLFGLGVARGQAPLHVFLSAVAIAVAAIPEGLPAVLTITLALGAQRMLRRGALIRNLPAVETLGSVTTICSDKTGTLTENRMRVVAMNVGGLTTTLDGAKTGENKADGAVIAENAPVSWLSSDQMVLWVAGALCNDASLQLGSGSSGQVTAQGDPTEGAILVAAAQLGMPKSRLEESFPRVAEAPFSFERKRMATVHRSTDSSTPFPFQQVAHDCELVLFVKGSPESVLEKSDHVLNEGLVTPLDAAARGRIRTDSDALARQGQRVLGVAYRRVAAVPEEVESLETDLVFVGLLGLLDSPRRGVREAVEKCWLAGIRPVMITGDHPLTALEIARQLKIVRPEETSIVTGSELSRLTAEELEVLLERVSVYARVEPEHKLRIVEALQRRGHIVAMTGDGVNDAPTLRRANIGVAMGVTGSDVAKEASAIVITDDNFATIVSAIEEGRTIYDNVRKFVKYIVTSNSAEVMVMLLAAVFGFPLPLTTLQILWINLVTDGVSGLALGLEPTEPDTMTRKPFGPGESLFSRGIGPHIARMSVIMAMCCLGVGVWAFYQWNASGPWGTMVFLTLTLSQLFYVMAVRSNRESLFRTGVGGNPLLFWSVILGVALQLCLVYWGPLQTVFGTQALSAGQLLLCLASGTTVFWAAEVEKWFLRRRERTAISCFPLTQQENSCEAHHL